ncbi:MAG: trans-aconitate 2-methyltransferase [Myxococcales bacterium]
MGPPADWDPALYLRFQAQREEPWRDLVALVRARPGMRVADLGCGPGPLTRRLHEALGARETLGIDNSEAMLASARRHAGGGVLFAQADLSCFSPREPFDLLFSNAALHWVPEHTALLTRLCAGLAPGGQLAVQVPDAERNPAHETAREVCAEEPFRRALGGFVWRSPVLEPEQYAAWLHKLGFAEQQVRVQIYPHQLPSRESVVEWAKGALLTSLQKRLAPELFERFVARYRELLLPKLADEEPLFFPYRRILFWGVRAWP